MKRYNYHIIAIDDNIALLQTLKVVLGAHFERVATISDPKMIQGIIAGGNIYTASTLQQWRQLHSTTWWGGVLSDLFLLP